jgi:uncharacterized membrane protein
MKKLIVLALMLSSVSSFAGIKGYKCSGTEPFFGLSIVGKTLTLNDTVKTTKTLVDAPLNAAGMSEGFVSVYKNKKSDINLTIVSGSCSDGMSDNTYDYNMVYTKGSIVLYGCCTQIAK